MDKQSVSGQHHARPPRVLRRFIILVVIAICTFLSVPLNWDQSSGVHVPFNAAQIVEKCRSLNITPGPPNNFHSRSESDRFVPGTRPTLIKNATIWTGRVYGHEIVLGDILLDKGIIKGVGEIKPSVIQSYKKLFVIEANGAWVTPG